PGDAGRIGQVVDGRLVLVRQRDVGVRNGRRGVVDHGDLDGRSGQRARGGGRSTARTAGGRRRAGARGRGLRTGSGAVLEVRRVPRTARREGVLRAPAHRTVAAPELH